MKSYAKIYQAALERKGEADLKAHLPTPVEIPLADRSDPWLLSEFSKRVFQAGFNWKVVETKWPGFEEVFHGFDIGRNALMSDEDLDGYLKDPRIVRHATKILSIRDNAVFFSDLAREHGSAVAFIANWPKDDTIGLFELLKKRGSRLGGTTGQYALRFAGYGNFILSRSVVAALNAAGVIDGAATSKTALKAVQAAFNEWAAESGEDHATISRVLAMSVPD